LDEFESNEMNVYLWYDVVHESVYV